MLLDVFAWLGEVVGHGHGEAAAAAASGGRRGERDLGRGRVEDGVGSEGASGGGDRGVAGGRHPYRLRGDADELVRHGLLGRRRPVA